jgi:hypothetical protein
MPPELPVLADSRAERGTLSAHTRRNACDLDVGVKKHVVGQVVFERSPPPITPTALLGAKEQFFHCCQRDVTHTSQHQLVIANTQHRPFEYV